MAGRRKAKVGGKAKGKIATRSQRSCKLKVKAKKKAKAKEQKGKGLTKKLAKKAYVATMNKMTDGGLEAGEIHPPILVKGKVRAPKYLGPGSKLEKKLKAKVKPISEVDRVARVHDSRYALAKNAGDIRAADLLMIKKLKKIAAEGSDNKLNIAIAKYPIKGKLLLEKLGLAKPSDFTTYGSYKPENKAMIEDLVEKETQAGYGAKKKGKAKGKKVSPWIAHVREFSKKNGCSYKEAMSRASKTYKKPKSS